MNKKGDIDHLIMPIIILFIFLFVIYNVLSNEIETNCEGQKLILISINGMRDSDTGFISGGTTEQKNLLFNNGLLVTMSDYNLRDVDLYLNKSYVITKCEEKNSAYLLPDRIYYKLNKASLIK